MHFISLNVKYSILVIVLFETGAHRWPQTPELQGENLECLRYFKIMDTLR